MKWTSAPPMGSGWCWWRRDKRTRCEAVLIERYRGKLSVDRTSESPQTVSDLCLRFPACQWSDTPIPEPEE